MRIAALALPLALSLSSVTAAQQAAPASEDASTLLARAHAAGATDVTTRAAPGGGVTLGGKLGGAQFAIAIPPRWRGDGLVYAHGYSTPGTPVTVAEDPVTANPGGVMRVAYDDGVAAGHSAYDKDGLGVETGTTNTKRLRDFMVKLGAKRVYAVGDSMGGGIVVTLLETYPGAFAGGLARCGVVDSWSTLIGQLYDMRAAYNFLTAGTPYAIPGQQDVRRSALPPPPPSNNDAAATAQVWAQISRVAGPVVMLYAAAQQNPAGREAAIVRQVAAIGGFPVDAGALAFPLLTAALGADDIAATAGGQPYGNMSKVYAAPELSAEEAAALNKGIQRFAAIPAAVAYFERWHRATGRISVPLVTMHNQIDSLVPFAQETAFAKAVSRAGRDRLLAAYAVPPKRAPLPVGGIEAYTHCGFSPEQSKAAWEALRGWVETGKRPAPDAVR